MSVYHVAYHSGLGRLCARVTAPGTLASARRGRPKNTLSLAPLAQGATLTIVSTLRILSTLSTLSILSILKILGSLSILRTLSQKTGLGQPGAGGDLAARAVVGEAPEQGLASALHLQLGASHVTDQRLRERPVSQNFAWVRRFKWSKV